MDNELKDIVAKLDGYSGEGWTITNAQRNEDGSWYINIRPKTKKEAADDNDK
jgi:hypothetical protein